MLAAIEQRMKIFNKAMKGLLRGNGPFVMINGEGSLLCGQGGYMKYLVTSAEMKEYDNNTIERIGIPALVLMERAAMAVRDEILKYCSLARNKNVLIVVGSGNNGADGLALARLLSEEDFLVSVIECGDPENVTESYKKQKKILKFYDVKFLNASENTEDDYDFVVDGIFGVGLSRTVKEKYAQIIEWLNKINGIKVAIDIPSGIDATTGKVMGTAFQADLTVTFGFGKRGLYLYPGADYAGRIIVAEIGINSKGFFDQKPEMFLYDESPEMLLPVRKRDGNKGTFGKVLLIAGWENMAGAAVMSAKAVLRMGAGMIKVFCSEQNRLVLQSAVPEAMYTDRESFLKDIQWADVIVAGPGLGRSKEAELVLEQLMKETKPILLDADALNLVAEGKVVILPQSRIVMTPHVGELSRLTGKEISEIKSCFPEVVKEAALDYDSVMVCKDARTLVYAHGKPMYLNVTGNSGMATAGSGDVLAGLIGGLLAQGMDLFEAACVGVYLHGLAGDAAAGKVSEYGVTATSIIDWIMEIMHV